MPLSVLERGSTARLRCIPAATSDENQEASGWTITFAGTGRVTRDSLADHDPMLCSQEGHVNESALVKGRTDGIVRETSRIALIDHAGVVFDCIHSTYIRSIHQIRNIATIPPAI